jgi:WD40 repeat protein
MRNTLAAVISARVDFDFSDPCYVTNLCSNWSAQGGGSCSVAAALSNNVLKVYRHDAGDLQHTGDLSGHTDRITDVYMPEQPATEAVVSSSDDGSVRLWDIRSGACEQCAAKAWSHTGTRGTGVALLHTQLQCCVDRRPQCGHPPLWASPAVSVSH